jgi:multiple sugar transport system substrate-binding protein
VAAKTRHKDAALALVDFLTGEEEVEHALVGFSVVAALKAAYDADGIGGALPPHAAVKRALEVARPRPVTPYWPQISEAIFTNVNAALEGRLSPRAALRAADRRIDRILTS